MTWLKGWVQKRQSTSKPHTAVWPEYQVSVKVCESSLAMRGCAGQRYLQHSFAGFFGLFVLLFSLPHPSPCFSIISHKLSGLIFPPHLFLCSAVFQFTPLISPFIWSPPQQQFICLFSKFRSCTDPNIQGAKPSTLYFPGVKAGWEANMLGNGSGHSAHYLLRAPSFVKPLTRTVIVCRIINLLSSMFFL